MNFSQPFLIALCLAHADQGLKHVSTDSGVQNINVILLTVPRCLIGLHPAGPVLKSDGQIHPRQWHMEDASIYDYLLNGAI